MGYTQVNSSAPMQGDLNGTLFDGDHGPEGVFQSLKGMMITPVELSYDVQDHNDGPNRLAQQVAPFDGWKKTGPVESGTFDPDMLTRGTDKHMPK